MLLRTIIHVLLLTILCFFEIGAQRTALEDYVNFVDPIYHYELEVTYDHFENYTIHVLNVTSQRWLDDSYSDRPIWWHNVVVAVPWPQFLTIRDQAALFYVGGGKNDNPIPPGPDELIHDLCGEFAYSMGAVVACVDQIPNAPIVYNADPLGSRRSSDKSIAFSWRQWTMIDNMTSPVELLLYFPMVKGGVRALDSVVDFIFLTYGDLLDKWVVGGPSKWGWSAWLHAAVDDRVIGLVPMVMNLLNNKPCMQNMYKSLGGWSVAMEPYWRENITTLAGPKLDALNLHQDVYSYRHLLNKPKLMPMGSSDEYFFADNTWYWLDDMPGENIVWVMPNTNHVMLGQWERLVQNTGSFFRGLHVNFNFPRPIWTRGFTSDGAWLEMGSTVAPRAVVGWRANATHYDVLRRDYRWFRAPTDTDPDPDIAVGNNITWYEETPEITGPNTWRLEFSSPQRGWEAFFMEMTYAGPDGEDMWMSTEVQITPDTYPYPECVNGPDCKGTMV